MHSVILTWPWVVSLRQRDLPALFASTGTETMSTISCRGWQGRAGSDRRQVSARTARARVVAVGELLCGLRSRSVLRYSLSVDNHFVFMVSTNSFAVPPVYQARLLIA